MKDLKPASRTAAGAGLLLPAGWVVLVVAVLAMALLPGAAGAAAAGQGAATAQTSRVPADLVPTGPVHLEYWHFYSGTIGAMHQRLVEEFNQTHPGIRVEAVYGGSTWTMRDKLLVALTSGAGPDVASIDQFWIAQLAAGNHVVPAEELMGGGSGGAGGEGSARSDAGSAGPTGPAAPSDFDDIFPLYWETSRYQGRTWSVPFAVSYEVMYYNLDLMAELGLSEADLPRTWNDLLALARRVSARTDTNGDGRRDLWILDVPTTAQTGVVYPFIITLWQRGGELFAPEGRRVAFDSVEGAETLAFWQELVRAGVLDLKRPDRVWEGGRALLQFASSARVRSSYGSLPFRFGVAPLPYDRHRVTGIGGRNLAVFTRDPQRQAAAWTFVRWMTSDEVNRRWSEATGYSPLRRSTVESAAYQALLAADPRLAVIAGELPYARPRPNLAAYGDVSRILGEAVERALYHGLDPAATLADAAREANAVITAYELREAGR